MLVGRYVPNLIAGSFGVTKGYAPDHPLPRFLPRLDKVFRKWDEEDWGSVERPQQLACVTPTELLDHQFASPIRWIETQDLSIVHDFERFIEIGPSPLSPTWPLGRSGSSTGWRWLCQPHACDPLSRKAHKGSPLPVRGRSRCRGYPA